MKAYQADYPVQLMCRLLKVSRSGYYAWRDRPLSARARTDISLTALIHQVHRRSRGAYGAPPIRAELADEHDVHVGCKRVARLMRAAQLRGVTPKAFVCTTTKESGAARVQDRVDREFSADAPDRLWVADITYSAPSTGKRRDDADWALKHVWNTGGERRSLFVRCPLAAMSE